MATIKARDIITIASNSVGGRNIYLNTGLTRGDTSLSWYQQTYTSHTDEIISDTATKSGKARKITYTVSGSHGPYWTGSHLDGKNYTVGMAYTQSCMMKATNDIAVKWGCEGFAKRSTNVVSSSWKRFTFTTTATEANTMNRAVSFYPSNVPAGTIFYIADYKMEEGSIATDWTPAPEDVNSAISTAQSTADNAAKTATNYLYQDSTNGLVVGYKDSSGNWAAARSQMKSDGFYVIRKDGTEVGHFKDSEVLIGNTTANNVLINASGMAIRNNGITYASFSSYSAQIGKTNADNVLINTNGMTIRKNGTTYASFSGSSARIGNTKADNVLINTNGMAIRNNGTTYAYFKYDSAQIGQSSGTNKNIRIEDDGILIREGTTNLAKFSSSTNTTFNLAQTNLTCGDLMRILTTTASTLSSSYSVGSVNASGGITTSTISAKGNARVGSVSIHASTSGLPSSSTFKNHTSSITMSSNGTDIYYENDTDNKYSQIYMGSDGSIGFNGSSSMVLGGSNTQIRTGLKIKSDTDGVNPYISFYRDSEKVSDTPAGRIILYDSNKYMSFNYAGRYIFDTSIYSYGNLALRSNDDTGTAVSTTASIATKWADGSQHNILERTGSGVVTALGWAGTGTYHTTTVLRGASCRLGSTSGTTITSDERLKKDFSSLDKWDKFFDNLEPCAFKMKAGTSGRYHVGFKAQQVEKALLESGLSTTDFGGFIKSSYVKYDDDNPDTLAVYEEAGIKPGEDEYGLIYTEFTALNTYEIQKLKKRIEALEDLLTKED